MKLSIDAKSPRSQGTELEYELAALSPSRKPHRFLVTGNNVDGECCVQANQHTTAADVLAAVCIRNRPAGPWPDTEHVLVVSGTNDVLAYGDTSVYSCEAVQDALARGMRSECRFTILHRDEARDLPRRRRGPSSPRAASRTVAAGGGSVVALYCILCPFVAAAVATTRAEAGVWDFVVGDGDAAPSKDIPALSQYEARYCANAQCQNLRLAGAAVLVLWHLLYPRLIGPALLSVSTGCIAYPVLRGHASHAPEAALMAAVYLAAAVWQGRARAAIVTLVVWVAYSAASHHFGDSSVDAAFAFPAYSLVTDACTLWSFVEQQVAALR